jgi:hypothetical protein
MASPFTAEQVAQALANIKGEIAEVHADAARRVKKLEQRADMFAEMLAELRPAATKAQVQLPIAGTEAPNIRSFLNDVLADGKPRPLRELVNLATQRGLLAASASPGRSVHAVMLGLMQNGVVRRQDNGAWVAKTRP